MAISRSPGGAHIHEIASENLYTSFLKFLPMTDYELTVRSAPATDSTFGGISVMPRLAFYHPMKMIRHKTPSQKIAIRTQLLSHFS